MKKKKSLIVENSTRRFVQDSFNLSFKGNELNASTHRAGGFLIFVEMKRHFLQYDIELFPLPEEKKNRVIMSLAGSGNIGSI